MDIAKIYIYGVIDSWQDNASEDYGYVNLTGIKKQLDSQPNFKEIEVHIHSEGGVVSEGFAIHDFLRSQGVPVTTIIDGMCASIATVVLLAGDIRVGTENAKPFIHNPWGMATGDKNEIRKYADELDVIENDIADFYASKTKLTKEKALEYMRNETTFTSNEALTNGLLTKIESVMRAVALLKHKSIKMAKEDLTKEDVKGMFDGVLNAIKNIGKKAKILNKTVTDANGVDVVFPDVEDDATEVVGDKATIDGAAAEGDVLMPSGETYVFAAGVLTEIKPSEEEEEDVEALKQKITDLETELADAKNQAQASKAKAKEHKTEVKNLKKEVETIGESVKELKKNIGSNFNYKPNKKNFKKTEGESRKVFKEKSED